MGNNWKQCTKCALGGRTRPRVAYEFGSLAHSICSCDRDFVENISEISDDFNPDFLNLASSECAPFPPAFRTTAKGGCCKAQNGVFAWYNKEIRECCESGQILEIGECWTKKLN